MSTGKNDINEPVIESFESLRGEEEKTQAPRIPTLPTDSPELFKSDEPIITKKKPENKYRLRNHFLRTSIAFSIIFILYLTAIYSSIPFIEKWRTIYIETAMTTNSHKWLATWFIPEKIIAEVMLKYNEGRESQEVLASTWENVEEIVESEEDIEFFKTFWELKTDSFTDYIKKHPSLVKDGFNNLVIEDLEGKCGIKTVEDDKVLVIDVPNNLIIIEVNGSGYEGKMAIVKASEQVIMAKAKGLGSFGQEIDAFCNDNDAILGINASGFYDPKGESFGSQIKGCLVIDGVDYSSHHEEPAWKYFGVKEKDERMYISAFTEGMQSEYRWAMEFYPGLIIDGKSVVDGTYGMGIQPRSTIGQTKDGSMLLLIVDGRQAHSIGCTVEDCANIMLRYHAYQGMNLDGGSSSVMYYKGKFITKSSSVTGRGRYMPNAILVKAAKDVKIKKKSSSDISNSDNNDSDVIKAMPAN